MTLILPGAEVGGGADGHVVRLRSPGGEVDLSGGAAQRLGHRFSGSLQRFLGILPVGVETGGVAELCSKIRQHRLYRPVAGAGGGGIVCIYDHRIYLLNW